MDRLTLFETFLQVVESGSFSRAGDVLNLTQSQVSKQIQRLEGHLGVMLFRRSTRQLNLTEAGLTLMEHAREAVDSYRRAEEAIQSESQEPEGTLRVLSSDGLGRVWFLPRLTAFLKRFPHIRIEHVISDQHLDLTEHNIHVALRLGILRDSAYRAKKLTDARRITVASPGYLARRGTPVHPSDLMDHDCIFFTRLAEYTGAHKQDYWEYKDAQGERLRVHVSGVYATDNSSAVKDATCLGLGIYQGPDWLFTNELASGGLVEILADYSTDAFPIHLLYDAHRHVPRRVQCFLDYFGQFQPAPN
jgi:DNA-binding transcriptional LysR family regulator